MSKAIDAEYFDKAFLSGLNKKITERLKKEN
jgi:hypothetical protein